ncbi:hypothetical protein ASPVEDRAFT_155969 [Aspergillus versicolor CBS 583.65]|uniref:Rhodopsin domain-containing protein n=1 Tax=Aspergillus versicolor CBS 583.65 TaxID=1036611 RepID=A0A1L9Q3J0_ASPVE|nr:uncharacterized protein ASPVEDRAFT_155969 [Aspergillus versicolor CBS 583.65]OJJ08288.1 hypothetical protein ASPVEDRAFT_155969 [Aspergillus versicolor CBS 583.65]
MSDPDADASRGWILHAVVWPLLGVCIIAMALRLWVRLRILRSWGWDDVFILLALLMATINTILVVISVAFGAGRHMVHLTQHQKEAAVKYQVLSQGFHVASTNFGKVSVALFLIRIIGGVNNHKALLYTLIGVMSLINLGGIISIYAQCTPTRKLWNFDLVEGHCWPEGSQEKYAFFQSSVSAFTDLILAIYPLFTIRRLQMAIKVKLGLAVVLSLGIIAMIAAIIKTTHLPGLTSYKDYSWETVNLTIWVSLEQYLIILAACIPALTPLFNIIVRHRSSKRSKSTTHELNGTMRAAHSKSKSKSRPIKTQTGNSDHQQYVPFASVGRDYVEYPLTWTVSSRRDRENATNISSGSDSETPITGSTQPQVPRGILRTTEFHIQEAPANRYEHVG